MSEDLASATRPYRQGLTDRWWWTILNRGSACHSCTGSLPEGSTVAYEPQERRVLCVLCADTESVAVECKPSRRYRNHLEAERKWALIVERGLR